MLEGSGLRFDCDWIDQGEDALRENYHDVALVCLSDRTRAHLSPIGARDRAALSLLCSTGIPAVIIGPDSVKQLLEGTNLNWDWTFVPTEDLDPDHLIHGIHDALQDYVEVSECPASSHRYRAMVELESSGF